MRAELRRLDRLVGRWVGDEEVAPSPFDGQGSASKATVDARMELDGAFLVTDYVVEHRDGSVYRGHGILSFDEGSKRYVMYWFDALSPGLIEPALGQWSGDVLTFEQRTGRGRLRYVYEFDAGAGYLFRIERSVDGTLWTPTMEGRYRKV